MQRTTRTYSVESVSNLHEKLLRWAQQYQTAIWLDSNKHHLEHSNFDNILAIKGIPNYHPRLFVWLPQL